MANSGSTDANLYKGLIPLCGNFGFFFGFDNVVLFFLTGAKARFSGEINRRQPLQRL